MIDILIEQGVDKLDNVKYGIQKYSNGNMRSRDSATFDLFQAFDLIVKGTLNSLGGDLQKDFLENLNALNGILDSIGFVNNDILALKEILPAIYKYRKVIYSYKNSIGNYNFYESIEYLEEVAEIVESLRDYCLDFSKENQSAS